jgi:hypothetical protein
MFLSPSGQHFIENTLRNSSIPAMLIDAFALLNSFTLKLPKTTGLDWE